VRQPALESIRRRSQHLFTPILAFRVEQLDHREGGVVAKLRSNGCGNTTRHHEKLRSLVKVPDLVTTMPSSSCDVNSEVWRL
jgi:hypothetical protein